ncbi:MULTISPECIES: pyridoxamine 5'-phosphate oxidase family protein [unclassified Blastococcus]|uniref:pyridoxamine 5'-phosphate oxidase family protein n=1 Tax=unclassified Blastococcus TaxID=2619396 RepID=UPI001EF154E9|nr:MULTISPECIES: pyridoxamine 5'-phosphate oxidase family protein [unclassified Blastococcus]
MGELSLPPGVLPVGARVLDEDECRSLLRTAEVGRLAVTTGALPAIVPVPFAVHDGAVVIPTCTGSALVPAVRGAVVAFAVDSYRPRDLGGWGVNVVGPARVVADPAEAEGLAALRLFPDALTAGRCFVSVRIGLLRGWRVEDDRLG